MTGFTFREYRMTNAITEARAAIFRVNTRLTTKPPKNTNEPPGHIQPIHG